MRSSKILSTISLGVPAPAYLEDDPWFGMRSYSNRESSKDYMVQEAEIKMVEEQQRSEETCESEDIHAKMYEIATQELDYRSGNPRRFRKLSRRSWWLEFWNWFRSVSSVDNLRPVV